MKTLKTLGKAAAAITVLGASINASAITVGFEGLAYQTAITSVGYGPGTDTLTISNVMKKNGGYSEAWVYDTTSVGADPDLTGPFASTTCGSSLSPGNVLIVQENFGPNSAPDDNGSGGSMKFEFASDVFLKTIDVLDVKLGAVTFKLYSSVDSLIGTYLNLTNADTHGPTGNKYETVEFNAANVAWMTVALSDSGALDNFTFDVQGGGTTDISNVPLPGAVWLFGTALLGFVGARARRARQV